MSNESFRFHYPLSYQGNLLWLVLFLLIWPPLGLLLLLLNGCVRKNGTIYSLEYQGNPFWLFFWTLLFFPVAIFLGVIKGFDVIGKNFYE
jgi:hypothetical protein